MALTNIEYGSLASSEVMNKNFLYLDDKISETAGDLNTNISSIYSNIATINTRVSDLSEVVADAVEELNNKLKDFSTRIQMMINNSTLVPDWKNCVEITSLLNYEVQGNGYILINPKSNIGGQLAINSNVVIFKTRTNNYDNAAQLVPIPVKEGDIITCDFEFNNAYYLPVIRFSLDDIVLEGEDK